MTTYVNGDTGVSKVQDGVVVQADLAPNVAGNGPLFMTHQNVVTSISSGSWQKVSMQVEDYDTAGAFDNVTNFQFKPLVAGYYSICGTVSGLNSATGVVGAAIYRNGAAVYKQLTSNASIGLVINVSGLVYLNGSTDYVELHAFQNSGGALNTSGAVDTTFSGTMTRAA